MTIWWYHKKNWNRNDLGGGLYWPNICICICICVHYLILRSHDEITRAGAKELVRMSHRGCCRGGPTAHPLVDLLPLLHPFFGHITTFLTFWLLPLLHLFWTYCHQVDIRARWFLWNVSANSHMTSVTKRNMLDPTGKVGDCSYTRHNHHPLGWIFLQGENMSFFSFLIFFRKHCLHNVLNLHQLPNGTYRCYNCVPHILPTPCTSLTYVAEKVPS